MGDVLMILIALYVGYRLYKYLADTPRNDNQHNGSARNNTHLGIINTNNRRVEETGILIYFANDRYNLPDREYRFNYRFTNGTWRAYIIRTPDTQNGRYIPHTLRDGDMRYICWDTSVTSLKDMQNISRQWADNVQKYIATGTSF